MATQTNDVPGQLIEVQQTGEDAEWRARELESALSAVAEGLIVLDFQGRIVRMNQAGQAVYGYTQAEMSLPLEERVKAVRFESPEGEAVPAQDLPGSRALKGETVINAVYRFSRGEAAAVRWLSMNAAPIRRADGSSMGAVVTFQDITERVETDTALRQTKEFLELLINTSHCAVFVLGKDGRFLTENKACERITGYPAEEVLGRYFTDFLPKDFAADADEIFSQVVSGGFSIIDREVPFVHKDGSIKTFLLSAAPLREAGRITSVIGSGVDISERKVLETNLVKAVEQAEAATRAKSEFLANMSHEIRTPMTGILGMTGLALKTCTEPKAREFLLLAKQSGEALLAIINDILDLSKIEAGKIELEKKEFHLRELLELVLESFELTAQEKKLRLTHSVDQDVPNSLIGDAMRLRQILINLLGNAIKFTKQGRVAVAVKRGAGHPPGQEGVTLVFAVQDTGVGISPDKLGKIFESFSQAHIPDPKYGGTGLGLTISRELAGMMGGRIWVESEMDRGSTFFFTARFGLGAEEQEQDHVVDHLAPAAPLPALKILLSEDNPVNQILAVSLLQRAGHTVTLANNGLEALDALRREPFDVVLMDVRMPMMDGEEATQRIRTGEAGEDRRDIPIVALTAHALVGDRERFLAAGMDDYISKPINAEDLTAALARCLAKRRNGEPRAASPESPAQD
ncbi:PAS domain-containing hybrid sensor histidine kinase/response regulator [Fundidesulfovibrio terrae]|uniref:PAS domain-containing hybrid sensor histidine kinase/response regulator n=1 Tax=Fundidesulfovibrio terrae TaxID=2922866 RepID=UPI001FB001A1|nr:PAS domain-containing hybrid sensor histidine kinase/response regulator [Fundidesulfovibrio terrae]